MQGRPTLLVLDPAICLFVPHEFAHEGIIVLEDSVDQPEREGESLVEVLVR